MNDRTILRDQESEAKYALLSRPFLSRQFRKGGLAFSPHIRQTSSPRRSMIRGRSWQRLGVRNMRASLSDLLMNIVSSAGILIAMAGICLDRILQQRSALRKPDTPFDFPPLCGGSRALLFTVGSELARAVCQSASKLADLRNSEFLGVPLRSLSVKAGCFATNSRAHSEHLSQAGVMHSWLN